MVDYSSYLSENPDLYKDMKQSQKDRLAKLQALQPQTQFAPGILETVSGHKKASERFLMNLAEFYSHPGAYESLQQSLGMFGREAPDLYGPQWESAMRYKIGSMAGSEQQMMQQKAEQGLAQRGLFGALGQSAQTQIGQAGAQSRLQAMMGLRSMLDDKRMELFEDQFARDYQATGLLQTLVTGQPAYPIMQKNRLSTDQKIMGYMGAAGNFFGGLSGLLGGGGK